jgi:NAD(P)H-dependent FMN reductase
VSDLRARIAAADGVLVCTPEYAGTLPGSLKNALDWTVRGGQLYEKPAAWLNVANPGRGAGAAAHLELVLGYVGVRVVPQACLRLPWTASGVGADGVIADPAVRDRLAGIWPAFARAVAAPEGE